MNDTPLLPKDIIVPERGLHRCKKQWEYYRDVTPPGADPTSVVLERQTVKRDSIVIVSRVNSEHPTRPWATKVTFVFANGTIDDAYVEWFNGHYERL